MIELLLIILIVFIVATIVTATGFGLAFSFCSTVLVPWLGVSSAWVNAVTLLLSIALTGVCIVIVVGIAIALLSGGLALFAQYRVRMSHRNHRL